MSGDICGTCTMAHTFDSKTQHCVLSGGNQITLQHKNVTDKTLTPNTGEVLSALRLPLGADPKSKPKVRLYVSDLCIVAFFPSWNTILLIKLDIDFFLPVLSG